MMHGQQNTKYKGATLRRVTQTYPVTPCTSSVCTPFVAPHTRQYSTSCQTLH